MTKKEKAIFDDYYNAIVTNYSKALRGDDKYDLDSCLAKFYVITDLKESLENCNNEAGA
ncbi:hypothetical protein [Enterocloster asparagiformis]|uniref:hypothetical protein n=1 Tax=Enterocloster asparagiformis TaxID=333367 RepID=UPI0004AF70CB|nr:hypothetical protein [Enterocloster asparagiformis]